MKKKQYDVRVQLVMDDELIGAIDEWRSSQQGVPSRSETIREAIRQLTQYRSVRAAA